MIGETGSVRIGEEFSVKALSFYRQSHKGFRAGEIVVEQFPGGSSNLTYLVRVGKEYASPSAVRQPAAQFYTIYHLFPSEEPEWRTH